MNFRWSRVKRMRCRTTLDSSLSLSAQRMEIERLMLFRSILITLQQILVQMESEWYCIKDEKKKDQNWLFQNQKLRNWQKKKRKPKSKNELKVLLKIFLKLGLKRKNRLMIRKEDQEQHQDEKLEKIVLSSECKQ